MAFLGPNDMLVLEKATGKVQRVVNGVVQSIVLDLPVDSASERGLLGIGAAPALLHAERRRDDADEQSVLLRRRVHRRRGRGEHPEDLRLRPSEQLRDGLRSGLRRSLEQENGDDSFSELNRADPGFNSGWVQIMGPPERIAQFKAIETTVTPSPPDPFAAPSSGLQQIRW
jgi:hypothetical protein